MLWLADPTIWIEIVSFQSLTRKGEKWLNIDFSQRDHNDNRENESDDLEIDNINMTIPAKLRLLNEFTENATFTHLVDHSRTVDMQNPLSS